MKADQPQRRADALGRFVAAAQAEADRFHGPGVVRAWQPRQAASRRRPSKAAVAALSMTAMALVAGAWLILEPQPADTAASSAAPTAPAAWFVAVAQPADAVTDEAPAPTARVVPEPAARPVVVEGRQPAAPDAGVIGLMNVPNPPDESAQVDDESQDTSYDQGDGEAVPQE